MTTSHLEVLTYPSLGDRKPAIYDRITASEVKNRTASVYLITGWPIYTDDAGYPVVHRVARWLYYCNAAPHRQLAAYLTLPPEVLDGLALAHGGSDMIKRSLERVSYKKKPDLAGYLGLLARPERRISKWRDAELHPGNYRLIPALERAGVECWYDSNEYRVWYRPDRFTDWVVGLSLPRSLEVVERCLADFTALTDHERAWFDWYTDRIGPCVQKFLQASQSAWDAEQKRKRVLP